MERSKQIGKVIGTIAVVVLLAIVGVSLLRSLANSSTLPQGTVSAGSGMPAANLERPREEIVVITRTASRDYSKDENEDFKFTRVLEYGLFDYEVLAPTGQWIRFRAGEATIGIPANSVKFRLPSDSPLHVAKLRLNRVR